MIRFYLNEIAKAKLLGSDDMRYVRKWCESKQVPVYNELNKQFISHADFEIAYNSLIADSLRQKYPDKWEETYRYYNYGEIYDLIKLRQNYCTTPNKEDNKSSVRGRLRKYKPESKASKRIHSKFLSN